MADLNGDLGKIVEHGVNARVEAAVLAELANSDLMEKFVIAALSEQVDDGRYGSKKKPLLRHLLEKTIQEKTKEVVAEEVVKYESEIRQQVREALGKSLGVITDSLVSGFVENANGRYPSIEVNFRGRD